MQRTSDRHIGSEVQIPKVTPMIYVASVMDYNAGRLVGRWFDLDKYVDAADLLTHIADWLEDLQQTDGISREEWAVHDAEGVGDIGPHPSTKILNEYLAAIHEGLDLDALEKYVDAGGYPSAFRDRYVGTFESPADFGVALLELSGALDQVPLHLRPYVDVEAYGQDALMGSYFESDGFYFLRA
jgi:antirestriction protein